MVVALQFCAAARSSSMRMQASIGMRGASRSDKAGCVDTPFPPSGHDAG
jgi:hypothetical protein